MPEFTVAGPVACLDLSGRPASAHGGTPEARAPRRMPPKQTGHERDNIRDQGFRVHERDRRLADRIAGDPVGRAGQELGAPARLGVDFGFGRKGSAVPDPVRHQAAEGAKVGRLAGQRGDRLPGAEDDADLAVGHGDVVDVPPRVRRAVDGQHGGAQSELAVGDRLSPVESLLGPRDFVGREQLGEPVHLPLPEESEQFGAGGGTQLQAVVVGGS
ncbi:hypothetical protein ACI1MP_09480 [Kitasatospora griseola]|uniref:hypothetical protein n=1 Tax=Kitasatospora griseola TaxID=2064 RepID=UPI003855C41E